MDGSASLPDGFTWTGSLDETDIRSLYAACHSLRFSGRLQLKDGAQHAEVLFVAGEPVEIDGGDTQRIALWSRGTFCAMQAIPSLQGELTGQRQVSGSLAATKPSALWAWISEYRLTCEIELERPGAKALVSFLNGHADAAQVNGLPELAALARVSSWTDGSFVVRLRPLFVDGVIPVAPPMPDGAPPADPRTFDVSRSIPMDLRSKQSAHPPVGSRAPTPPLGELAMHQAKVAAEHRTPASGFERSGMTQPLPPGTHRPAPEELPDLAPKRGKGFLIVALTSIVLAGGAGALYYFHLPPFSPPPKPIVDTPPKPVDVKPEEKPVDKPVEAKPEEKPVEVKPVEPPKPPVAEEKAVPVDDKKEKANRERAEKLVAKGRMLLVEGHEHTALDLFRKAEKLQPKNNAYKVFEQQALGKLGRAEVTIEGKGQATIDGHKFAAPRKLKLAAGPHDIDSGEGASEVTLKRGEKKKLKVKK